MFHGDRLCYVASREGHSVDFMSYIDHKRNTPSLALMYNVSCAIAHFSGQTFPFAVITDAMLDDSMNFQAIVGTVLAVTLDIEKLIDCFGFTVWIFYGATVAAMIRFRYTLPDAPRPFKVA